MTTISEHNGELHEWSDEDDDYGVCGVCGVERLRVDCEWCFGTGNGDPYCDACGGDGWIIDCACRYATREETPQ